MQDKPVRRLKRGCSLILIALLAAGLAPSPARADTVVTIRGGGWGHGIGMSQYGAYARAKNGKSAANIVGHYYNGSTIGTLSMPRRVRVGLLQYQSSIKVRRSSLSTGTVAFKVKGSSTILAKGRGATWEVRPSSTGGMQLFKNGNRVVVDGKRVFGSPSKPLQFIYESRDSMAFVVDTGRRYAYGTLEFGSFKSGSCGPGYCTRLVLLLPMQKYLYGLGEMPSSWGLEALKVQALAGRTYAYRKIKSSGQHRIGCDCALYDSPVDQAYVGDAKRDADSDGTADTYWPRWKTAVDSTDKGVILYNGEPIQALYSSSSGGHTEHNENVWGGGALPYLRGVRDKADAVSINPNHRWTVKMSWSTLSSKLNAYYGTGTLKSFRVISPVGVSGRVTVVRSDGTGGVKIVGSRRTVRASGWSVRSALGLKDTLFSVDIGYTIGRVFRSRYKALDGAPGTPRSATYSVPPGSSRSQGRAQNFSRGRMTWRKSTGKVVWQRGPVLRKYDSMGRESSPLRMPVSDVRVGSYHVARYVRGMIVYSSRYGARAVVRKFSRVYRRHGGPSGVLGVPRREAARSRKLPDRGRLQRFRRGTLYHNPHSRRVQALWGKIDGRYRRIGMASSRCGYPTSHVVVDGRRRVASFENGRIVQTRSGAVRVRCRR